MHTMGDAPAIAAADGQEFNDNYSASIRDHFPFPSVRVPQELALQKVEEAVREGKKYIVLEIPTGGGKSGIAIAAGSWAKTMPRGGGYEPGAYIATPQKSLQEQYMREFASRGLVLLKGMSNYLCDYWYEPDEGGGQMNCEDAAFCFPEEHKERCTGYKLAKGVFCNTPIGTTNFSYYLAETNHAGQLPDRTMLVLDEAHGTEEHILSLANIELTKWRCEEVGIDFYSVPYITPNAAGAAQALDWLNTVFRPKAVTAINDLNLEAESLRDSDRRQALKIVKKAKGLERFVQSLDMFLRAEDRKDWMVWSESEATRCPRCRSKVRPGSDKCWRRDCKADIPQLPAKMIIKPLTATLFADRMLFSKAEKVIMMSATILDFSTFLRNLGIDRKDAVCLALPSSFPVQNLRILYRPVANMSARTIDQSLPLVCAEVERLMRKHRDEKGIIHTHTYKITRHVVEYLRSRGMGDRILTHEEGVPGDRERTVQRHIESRGPTVIISPSMTEGLDLKDDLSRFSIVMKVPYPFLSNYVKARMDRDPEWYAWRTALALQQATGRSNRTEEDWATHYILDAGFGDFIRRSGHIFSPWWSESVFFPGSYEVDW